LAFGEVKVEGLDVPGCDVGEDVVEVLAVPAGL
jgi:hypothetical protein